MTGCFPEQLCCRYVNICSHSWLTSCDGHGPKTDGEDGGIRQVAPSGGFKAQALAGRDQVSEHSDGFGSAFFFRRGNTARAVQTSESTPHIGTSRNTLKKLLAP